MARRYTGGFLSSKEQVTDVNTSNGIFTLSEHQERTALGNFPTGRWTPSRSLRFRDNASTYLSRNAYPVLSAGTQWTLSFWIKRASVNTQQDFFSFVNTGNGTQAGIQFQDNGTIRWWQWTGGYNFHKITTAQFNDPSAWYHFTFVYDTTLAVAEDRCQIWVNGFRQTSFGTNVNPSQNLVTYYKNGSLYPFFGAENRNNSSVLYVSSAYFSEVNFIDGQASPPTAFGFTDPETGTWVPKRYTGTYGGGGFYLPFSNNTGSDQLGRDFGNGGSEFVTNGFFDANVTGWSTWPGVGGSPFITWQSTGRARIGNTQNNGSIYYQAITTEIGRTYYATASVSNISIGANGRECRLQWAASLGGAATTIGSIAQPNSGIISGSFVATSTTSYILLNVDVLGSGTQGADWDSISVSDTSIKNHWNAINFSLTPGSTYDSMVDVPGIASTTSLQDVGGVVRGNYCTLSSVNRSSGGGTLSEANLRFTTTGGNHTSMGTIAFPPTGKWYFEVTDTVTGGNSAVGISPQDVSLESNFLSATPAVRYNNMDSNAVFGFAVDMDNLTYTFYKNNVISSTVSPATGTLLPGVTYVPFAMTSSSGGASMTFNFGQRPFAYTPPTGFRSLNTTNLPNPSIKRPQEHFDIKTWTGNGNSQTIGTTNKQTTSYQIDRSLRFRKANSAYLSRTPSITGSQTTWTWSGWVKQTSFGTSGTQWLLTSGNQGSIATNYTALSFSAQGFLGNTNQLQFYATQSNSTVFALASNARFESSTGWYHVVASIDTAQTSPSERVKLYVNGVRITQWASSTFPSQNTSIPFVNSSSFESRIGSMPSYGTYDGYMTEVNFIDGQALTPSSFGQFDANNNWLPTRYTGTYGTNGYYLTFNNNTLDTNVTLNATATAPFGGVAANATTDNGVYFASNTSTGSSFFALRYDFGTQTQVTRAILSAAYFTGGTSATWAIWGSNDDSNYTTLASFGVTNSGTNYNLNINGNFRYYYLRATNFGTNGQVVLDGFTLYQDGLGLDSSGIGNNWTPTNFSVTAGVTNDSLLDSPTDYDDGSGNIRGNYCVLDANTKGSFVTLSNAGLTTAGNTSSNSGLAMGTLAVSSGKWYWEMTATTAGQISYMGVAKRNSPWSTLDNVETFGNNGYAMILRTNGELFGNEKVAASTTSFTNGDVMACALDMDSGALYISKNGTWLNSGNPVSGSAKTGALFTWGPGSETLDLLTPIGGGYNGNLNHFNFGQRAFTYTPPAGFRPINTKNLKDVGSFNLPDTFGNYVNTPDLIWIKNRSNTYNHIIQDTVRGPAVYVDLTSAAQQPAATGVQAFLPNGFQIGSILGGNANLERIVGWTWNRGRIPGFDIVTYGGNSTASQTISHNLGVKPAMMIVKSISSGVASWNSWNVWHQSLSNQAQSYLRLGENLILNTSSAVWGNAAPGNSTFTVGWNAGAGLNGTGDSFIAYLWAEVPGFSKFGTYTGNASSEGPFINTGFRPAFVMIKRTDATSSWIIYDVKRDLVNPCFREIQPNSTESENSGTSNISGRIDILSNGFKERSSSSDSNFAFENASGGTYVYAAFAEAPFKYANAR